MDWPWRAPWKPEALPPPTTCAPAQRFTPLAERCVHTGHNALFKLRCAGGVEFTFAGARGNEVIHGNTLPPANTVLAIDLAGMVDLRPPRPPTPLYTPWYKSGPILFKSLEPPKPPDPLPIEPLDIPVLRLDWSDQKAPPEGIGPAWWAALLDALPQEYPHGGHVIVACVGSHGRTGTALAALLLAGRPKTTLAGVAAFIRKEHCENAIESRAQWAYLTTFRPKEVLPEWIEEEMAPSAPPAPTPAYDGAHRYVGGVWEAH